MQVHAAEATFNAQFVHRVQKLANTHDMSTGEAAIELMVTAQAPPVEPRVEPPAASAEVPPHIDVIA